MTLETILRAVLGQLQVPSVPGAEPASAKPPVDVAAVLDAKSGGKLNWRDSVVDLLKALKHDSSFSARQKLARQMNYTGSLSDSAAINDFLHTKIMNELAAAGGNVPDDLK